ncbi:rod shape-determining protein MreC [Gorillibacterium timonense]|uniref:rod shape-determining protein MreC n=1 Tax=Gorillibacterium timonense TaxID=1689269 RepID=UPI000A986CD2|nr:rod shape-determining protein MreC [Gorillibacterium timonense]
MTVLYKLMGNKKLLVLMVSLIIFIALFGVTLSREKATAPERFLRDTVSWTQTIFNRPARFVANLVQDIRDIRTIYAENKTLRLTLTQYSRDTMKLNELEAQNLRLKDLLGFTEKQKAANNYRYHPAEVIAYSSDPYSKVITVNVGARDGVKKDMAVISVEGLVGRVMDASDFTSNVQLLTAIDSLNATDSESDKASATTPTKGISATVKGKESDSFGVVSYDPETGLLIMSKISPSDPVAKGDTIVTSGIGGVFPKGIVIGTVLSKEVDKLGLNYIAYVQPAADFVHLREVLIVEKPE